MDSFCDNWATTSINIEIQLPLNKLNLQKTLHPNDITITHYADTTSNVNLSQELSAHSADNPRNYSL